MMIRAFEPTDLLRIRIAVPASQDWRSHGPSMLAAGPCWSAVHDGAVLGCAGFVLHWPGRAGTWCMIGDDFPRTAWPWLHKQVRRRIAELQQGRGVWRIEAETRLGFRAGARWMHLLGFRGESAMPGYGTDGATYLRWAAVTRGAA